MNIIATYNGTLYPICLYDVLYVPGNRNNLFSLRHWIAKGGDFLGQKLTLIFKQGNIIAHRMLTKDNLIKFCFCSAKCEIISCDVMYPSLI
jgi:hypothetical protein